MNGRIVSESTVGSRIAAARQAIGDDGKVQSLIRTAPRKGLRFVAEVREIQERNRHQAGQALPVDAHNATSTPRPALPGAERRQVTIFACDALRHASHAEGADIEDDREAMIAVHGCVTEVIKRQGGVVARNVTGGLVAQFGYPRAREDDAERAVRAALAAIESVGRIEGAAPSLRLRVVVATGLVVADGAGDGAGGEVPVFGDISVLAGRLLDRTAPGEVLVSDSTRRLLGSLFEFRDLGRVRVKGSAKPVHIWQVLRELTTGSRFDALRSGHSELIGRQEELQFLLRRWEQAKAGRGRVVLVTGEAGIGKSRLVRALQERINDEAHTPLLHHCSPHHHGSALHPITARLLQSARIGSADDDETKLRKLRTLVAQSGENQTASVSLLAALLSIRHSGHDPTIPPHQLKEHTLRLLLDQVRLLAGDRPVLVVFEDLQWIDATSLEFLSLLVEAVEGMRVLCIATARPEFSPPWASHSHVSSLLLNRLDQNHGQILISRVSRDKPLPPDLVARILSRGDGVPLFIEELTKSVLESNVMREIGGRYELAAPLPSRSIPSTLEAAFLARLDNVGAAKEVAQIAAAIGRDFSYRLVATVSELPESDLQVALERLVDAEIVFPRGRPPDANYVFKHALVQDAAYASLVRGRRRELHSAIAGALQKQYPDVAVAQPELLAHHYTEADKLDEATKYWRKAGELALARSAYPEAASHFANGIEVVGRLPAGAERDRKELEFHLPLGPAIRAIKGLAAPEVLRVYSRAGELLRDSTPLEHQLAAQLGLWTVYWGRAEHTSSYRLAQQCLELAIRHQDAQAIARTNRIMGMTLLTMGRFAEARTHLQRCLDLSPSNPQTAKFPGHDDRATALSFLAGSLWLMGHPDRARTAASQALARAQEVGQPTTMAFVRYWEAIYGGYGSDPHGAAARTEALVAHCAEHRIASFQHLARIQQGAHVAQRGDAERGIAIMQDAMAAHAGAGGRASRPMHLGHLATAQASAGRLALALGLVEKGIREAETSKDRAFLAELHRLRGEVLLLSGKKRRGRGSLQRALTIARRQRAKFWELRAATTLAEFLIAERRAVEANNLLAPIADWFTEGLDLPDLKRAKLLLKKAAQS